MIVHACMDPCTKLYLPGSYTCINVLAHIGGSSKYVHAFGLDKANSWGGCIFIKILRFIATDVLAVTMTAV